MALTTNDILGMSTKQKYQLFTIDGPEALADKDYQEIKKQVLYGIEETFDLMGVIAGRPRLLATWEEDEETGEQYRSNEFEINGKRIEQTKFYEEMFLRDTVLAKALLEIYNTEEEDPLPEAD